MIEWLWTELRDQFEIDDGSLPEVHVNFVNRGSVVTAFALLRERGHDVTRNGGSFWSIAESETRALQSVENAAALVVSGKAAPFHCVLRGIQVAGVQLPDLGVFVLPDQVTLDYRMGPEWGPRELGAFFQLLLDLARLDPDASVGLEDSVLPEVAANFQRCWSRFVAERAT